MDRRHFLIAAGALTLAPVLAQADDTSASALRGLLWRVRCGEAPPSHLFGTLHSGDRRVLSKVPALRPLVSGARLFMPELLTDADAVNTYVAASVYGSDELPRKVGKAKWPRVEKMLGLHGVDPRVAVQLRPWAALITLLQPLEAQRPSLDEVLIELARRSQIPVQPIERVQEQIDAIASLPEPTLIALLVDAARRHDVIQAGIEPMIAAWLDGKIDDLARINAGLMSEEAALRDHSRRFIHSLLDGRNARFAERLLPEIRQGGVFAAFGASHLTGAHGVIDRLKAAGCEVDATG